MVSAELRFVRRFMFAFDRSTPERDDAMIMGKSTDAAVRTDDVVWIEDTHVPSMALPERDVFSIGDLAREFGVTLRTLRFYEGKGLLAPRREGLVRLYSKVDRDRLALILRGKKLGFTLGEIAGMIAAEDGRGSAHALKLGREKCLAQIGHLERQVADLQEGLAELRRIYAALSRSVPAGTTASVG